MQLQAQQQREREQFQFELRKLELQIARPVPTSRESVPQFFIGEAVKLIPKFTDHDIETFLIFLRRSRLSIISRKRNTQLFCKPI